MSGRDLTGQHTELSQPDDEDPVTAMHDAALTNAGPYLMHEQGNSVPGEPSSQRKSRGHSTRVKLLCR